MRNDSDPIARMTYVAGLIREALTIAEEHDEFLLAARLDDSLVCVRQRIVELRRRA